MAKQVAVIGAGMSGLSAALQLRKLGIEPLVLEASDAVGGRVRTDKRDGFLLDRGFQIFNTAYPTAKRLLDYDALKLGTFRPGALVRVRGQLHRMPDPLRLPSLGNFWSALRAPIGSLADKARLARLRRKLLETSIDEIWTQAPAHPTHASLRERGFSRRMIQRFFQPFYGGVFLEKELKSDARLFEFTFKMFAEGEAALPAKGMQALPDQLADRLGRETIHLGSHVAKLEDTTLHFEDRAPLEADAIILACDATAAHRLLEIDSTPHSNSVTCLYFRSKQLPYEEPLIALDGDQTTSIQTFCIPSLVQPTYAPEGEHLFSVSVLGVHDPQRIASQIESELRQLFPRLILARLDYLHGYAIHHALPRPGTSQPIPGKGQFLAGDFTEHASLEGALHAGEKAAQAAFHHLQAA